MKASLFNLLSALSLLLCVATAVLWVRSYTGSDYIDRRRLTAVTATSFEHRGHQLILTRGQVRFIVTLDMFYFDQNMKPAALTPQAYRAQWSCGRLGAGHDGWIAPRTRTMWNRLGFAGWQYGGWSSSFSDAQQWQVWAVPGWLVLMAFALMPTTYAWSRLQQRRRSGAGRCIACGYDLRATPERCPECGAAAATAPTS